MGCVAWLAQQLFTIGEKNLTEIFSYYIKYRHPLIYQALLNPIKSYWNNGKLISTYIQFEKISLQTYLN